VNAARALPKPTLEGVHLRDGEPQDIDFVRSSMLSDMERWWPYRSKCDGKLLFDRLLVLLPRLLARSQLRVAEKDGAIAAFAIIDRHENLVHWVRTAQPFRRLGLCRVLLSTLKPGWRFSSDTAHAATALQALGGMFDPYALVFLSLKEMQ
jgi:hypothetical protein